MSRRWRRVLVVLLWTVYLAVAGAGGIWAWNLGLLVYGLFLVFLWFVGNPVVSELADALMD